ncbi:MAG: hypothetical protein IPP81_12375 [Chitinophagaceae bacterium]|nr:hypothetical protein [Chitinophagaceae bacterium]
MALEVFENRKRRITTSVLNEVMQKVIEAYRPPVVRGNQLKIKYVTQLPTFTPSFAFFCNYPDDVKHLIRITWRTSYVKTLILQGCR